MWLSEGFLDVTHSYGPCPGLSGSARASSVLNNEAIIFELSDNILNCGGRDIDLFANLTNRVSQCVQINNAYSFLCAHLTHLYHDFLFVKWELLTSFMVVYNGWTRPISTEYKYLALAEQPRVKMITLMMDHTNKTCSNTFSKLRSCFFCS